MILITFFKMFGSLLERNKKMMIHIHASNLNYTLGITSSGECADTIYCDVMTQERERRYCFLRFNSDDTHKIIEALSELVKELDKDAQS